MPKAHAAAVVSRRSRPIARGRSGMVDDALAAAGTRRQGRRDGPGRTAASSTAGLATLGAGAILAGLILGSITAFIIDKQFLWAAGYSFAGAALDFVGLIHADEVGWNAAGRSRSATRSAVWCCSASGTCAGGSRPGPTSSSCPSSGRRNPLPRPARDVVHVRGRDAGAGTARPGVTRARRRRGPPAGFPLHPQLVALGARVVGVAMTAPRYRLLALAGGDVARGGIWWAGAYGASVEVELHDLALAAVGELVTVLPARWPSAASSSPTAAPSPGCSAPGDRRTPSTSPSTSAGRGTWPRAPDGGGKSS